MTILCTFNLDRYSFWKTLKQYPGKLFNDEFLVNFDRICVHELVIPNGTKYSRMDQVKFVENSPYKI